MGFDWNYKINDIGSDVTIFVNGQYANEHDELLIDEYDHLRSAEYIYYGSRGDYMVFNVDVAAGSFDGRDAVCDVNYINAIFVV